MVGNNINIHLGLSYREGLKKLSIVGLHAAISERRIFSPQEGVEVGENLFLDSVDVLGTGTTYRYLFIKRKNEVFLIQISDKIFSEKYLKEISAFVQGMKK
jgi:hypothetical protein